MVQGGGRLSVAPHVTTLYLCVTLKWLQSIDVTPQGCSRKGLPFPSNSGARSGLAEGWSKAGGLLVLKGADLP